MGLIDLLYVHSYRDRHGRLRAYYRRNGLRVPLKGDPGSPEFLAEYQRAHASFEDKGRPQAQAGTFGALVESYYASPEFGQLKPATKEAYRRGIDGLRAIIAGIRLAGVTRKVISEYRKRLADRPATANQAMRAIKTLFNWAIAEEILGANPAENVKALKTNSDGWQPWPAAALERFSRDSIGAPRTAFFLALYTGQRRGDVLRMRWDDIDAGGINVRQGKTGAKLWVPMAPALAEELARTPRKGLTIVQRQDGAPYTDDGFAAVWSREQHRLGCAGLPFHGLRKNATEALYEAGCTPQQVQAITGHKTLAMVQKYGAGANQRRMAKGAMKMLEGGAEERAKNPDPARRG
jgi:integrase